MIFRRENDASRLFSRRAAVLGGGQALLLTALVGRLYQLQVLEADRYATLADENRINIRLIAPPRGPIVDRFGRPLAVNRENYRILVVPEQTTDLEATLDRLVRLIRLPAYEQRRVLREARRKRSFVPVKVRENLTWEEVARVEVNAPSLPGVRIDVGQRRYYPYGSDLAHLVGYVGPVTEAEMTGDPLLELPGFRVGKAGMERVHDKALRGEGGTRQVEVNAVGRVIQELSREPGRPGARVMLTVDAALQARAADKLQGESAAAVVMDVHSGEVLTLASSPGFDPNAFSHGMSETEWQQLVNNERAPLNNKAIAGRYAPGSTFKMVTALAALETGAITPETTVFCKGHMEFGGQRFHCWKAGGHGRMNLKSAIQQSCDVFFYKAAKRTGIDAIAAMAERFGMGHKLGLALPSEAAGVVPTRDWKRANQGTAWQRGETLVTGIGQGYLLVTPLQLAVMTARLANGGVAVEPRLTRAVLDPGTEKAPDPAADFPDMAVDRASLARVQAGMDAVTNTPHGTAYGARIRAEGEHMAGKTGTAQVRRITMQERREGVREYDELPWEKRPHALFVAYAPVAAPRYACSVVVEHGGSGSQAAAPIARDILRATQERDRERDQARGPDGTRRRG